MIKDVVCQLQFPFCVKVIYLSLTMLLSIFQVVATFEEVSAGKTKIVFKMIFNSADECKKVKAFAGDKNEENFGRLENELAKMTL
jgi:hypothetical protein